LLNGKIEILEHTRDRLLIKILVQDYQFREDLDFTYIDLENWSNDGETGAPALPYKLINVAVPPEGNISYKIISERTSIKHCKLPLQPIPKIVRSGETSDFIFEINEDLFSQKRDLFLEIGEKARFRFNEYFPIKISPFLYDHSSGKIEIKEEMIIEILIDGDQNFRNEIPDKFDRTYKDFFLNYEPSKFWKTKSNRKINFMPFSDSDFWYRFTIEEEGLHGLLYQQLSQLPDFVEPDSIRIFRGIRLEIPGEKDRTEFVIQEVPIFINCGDDGKFDEEDFIYFENDKIEQDIQNLYSGKTVFWLTFGGDYKTKPSRNPDLQNNDLSKRVSDFDRYYHEEPDDRDRQIDCLMIAPTIFLSQSEELAQIHFDNYGLISEIVDQQTIFNLYGESPEGVRDYIESFFNDHPELEVVILMGSGTTNWDLDIEKNKIIAYQDGSDKAYDDYFVNFGGTYPDLPIGRIPAQNTSQMDLMIERIRNYIETPNLGWWRNKVLIVPDDENKNGHLEGTGGSTGLNHTYQAQYTGEILSNGVYVDKLMAIEYSMDEFLQKPEAREDMIDRINEGRLIWYYIGHGAEDILGDEGYFRGSLHIRFLENEEHLPLFIAASCNVGQFDDSAFDCLAEKLLFHDYGGSIGSIAATRSCGGTENTRLIRDFLDNALNERENIGWALWDAKIPPGASYTNSKLYHILGDPLISVITPGISGSITIDDPIADSLQARQTVHISGDYELENAISGIGEIRIFNTEDTLNYYRELNDQVYDVVYTKNGSCFFKGSVQTESNEFEAGFIIPDDVQNGERGRFISYISDNNKSDFISFFIPVKYSKIPVPADNNDAPSVQLWIDSKKFLTGDYVSTKPTLIAAISDSNGINISGSAGHKILLLLDNSNDPLDVTDHFIYDINSYTKGELLYEIDEISEGRHSLQLIVFDSFNVPTVANTEFISRKSGKVAIEQMLPYPNPMKDEGHFTFIITEDADIEITIYTITSRKIRILKKDNCGAGYNQIYWDTRDAEGDNIANNTYFYKIKAKQLSDGKITEKIGKVIILK